MHQHNATYSFIEWEQIVFGLYTLDFLQYRMYDQLNRCKYFIMPHKKSFMVSEHLLYFSQVQH